MCPNNTSVFKSNQVFNFRRNSEIEKKKTFINCVD